MGALAPLSHWHPEDDLLLKNAVEAGASLESLAKGAVLFSRKFTIRELQDRWHSLLYDESVASNVAEQILLLEPAALSFTKNSNFFSSRGKEGNSRKRNVDSVRTHYYSSRKRICNELGTFSDQGFLVGPTLDGGVLQNENNGVEQLIRAGPGCETIDLGQSTANHLLISERGFHSTDHGLDSGDLEPIGGELPDDIIGDHCLYGFTEDIPSSLTHKGVQSDPDPGLDSSNLPKDVPQTIEDNLNVHNGPDIRNIVHTESVSEAFLGSDDLHQKPVLCFDAKDDNFHSPVSDSVPSLNQLELSSPLQGLALWKALEEFSESVNSVESNLEVNKRTALPDVEGKELANSDYDIRSELKDRDCKLAFSDKDILDLSNSLLDFPSAEDFFCADIDEKDVIDQSCLDSLSSLLLNSHSADNAKEPINAIGIALAECMPHEEVVVAERCVQAPSGDGLSFSTPRFSEAHVPSHKITTYKYEECLFCTLNTEDPDIPDNSDIFPRCEVEFSSYEATGSGFISKSTCEKWEIFDEEIVVPLDIVSTPTQNMVGSAAKKSAEVPSVNRADQEKKSEVMDVSSPLHAFRDSYTEVTESDMVLEDNFEAHNLRKADGSEHTECFSQRRCKPEDTSQVIMTASSPNDHQHGEAMLSTSDHEDSLPESDSDVPYFSDIEAMILDMDLDPYDEESCFAREVSSYQYEDTKKTIIRLEQGANSCMQRAIASHGALAVFYGRKMKHYIKKSEVLIGRATDDVNVDIDLRKEGRANKVSRRQAVIKMEEDGVFYLTNLGKHPISVNNRDVASGQRTSLSSSCLIEIRGMRFMFEMNRHFDKRHVSNIASRRVNGGPMVKSEWLPYDNL